MTVIFGLEDGIISKAVTKDDTIFVTSLDRGKVQSGIYALGSTGKIKWFFETEYDCSFGAPTVCGGNLYVVDSGCTLYALSPGGDLIYKRKISYSAATCYAQPTASPDGETLCLKYAVETADEYSLQDVVVAISVKDGGLRWIHIPGTTQNTAAPTWDSDGNIYISGAEGSANTAVCLKSDGTLKYVAGGFSRSFEGSIVPCSDGRACAVDSGGNMFILDSEGHVLHQFTADGYSVSSPVVADNGAVYLGVSNYSDDVSGSFYALTDEAKLKWRHDGVGAFCCAPCKDAYGNILATADSGMVYCFTNDGDILWYSFLGGERRSISGISTAENGRVFVSSDGALYTALPIGYEVPIGETPLTSSGNENAPTGDSLPIVALSILISLITATILILSVAKTHKYF